MIYFITNSLSRLPSLHSFCPPPPYSSGNHKSVLCIYELGFCLALFLNFTYKRENTFMSYHIFLYPSVSPWSLRFLPYLGYCKHCCNEILCVFACLCVRLVAQSCLTLCDPMACSSPGSSVHGDSPSKSIGVGCHALLQSISPTRNQI